MFRRRFGLVYIDYDGGSLNRTLKDSQDFWITLAENRIVPLVQVSSASTLSLSIASALVAAVVCLSL